MKAIMAPRPRKPNSNNRLSEHSRYHGNWKEKNTGHQFIRHHGRDTVSCVLLLHIVLERCTMTHALLSRLWGSRHQTEYTWCYVQKCKTPIHALFECTLYAIGRGLQWIRLMLACWQLYSTSHNATGIIAVASYTVGLSFWPSLCPI
jgi:hypothetical protein